MRHRYKDKLSMSRSVKKTPIYKRKSNSRWYNRKFRRVNKERISKGKDPVLMHELISRHRVIDQWWWLGDSEYVYKLIRK